MPKPIHPRSPTVIISDHAFERWLERADRSPKRKSGLAALVETLLYNHLRGGGVRAEGLEANIELGGGLVAVLCLVENAWVCTTIRPDKEAG
ncbi:MAG TPA: hypothetical protein PK728_12065 [Bacillota bacterium]|mgnify:CR=1 FL=1|nr:hypothetical protein [Bacillota bacterium]